MKVRKNNPLRISFLSVAVVCCVALSIVFFYISYRNEKAAEEKYAQEKAERVMQEWEAQLQMMKEVALRIVSNYEFQPYYFKADIAKKLSMLETFKQYKYYIALTEDYFLDYGEEWIYTSGGKTIDFSVFLNTKSENEKDQQWFRDVINVLKKDITKICGDPKVLRAFNEIYVLIPLKVNKGDEWDIAILGFVIQESALEERFRIAGGEMNGSMELYEKEVALYSNRETSCLPEHKHVVTSISKNGNYTFCFLPEKNYNINSGLFLVLVFLVLTDILLIFVIANIFAKRAFEPIKIIAEKYRKKVSKDVGSYVNELEELDNILGDVIQSNNEAKLQIQKKQRIIRDQILCMVMNNDTFGEALSYLDNAEICLPGPYYCVISISCEDEREMPIEFLIDLQEELEQVPDKNEKEYVYTVCSLEKKLLNVICSAHTEAAKDNLVETIRDVAESFSYKPIIVVGNTYQSLRNVSASWLESMDDIQSSKKKRHNINDSYSFVYNAEGLRRIWLALDNGNEEMAVERLEGFVEELSRNSVSMLMLQYILADFLGGIRRLGEKYRLEVSKTNISLVVSAKSVKDFENAAKKLIHEFCGCYKALRSQLEEHEVNQIYKYINEHFSEYDISIEKVATELRTSTDAVREAILIRTGKLYRDYLIYLRIEYAKVLLRQEDIPVAELCQKVGYGNVSYFIKLFREVVGVTPAKYRKNTIDGIDI